MTDRNRTAGEDPPPRARRRHGEELVSAIHQAALEETAEHGLARVSMEGIARRAGTAKTSLYRRWSDPETIVLEALYRLHPMEQPSPGADDLRGDLVAALTLMLATFADPLYASVMPSVLAEAQRRPDLHERLYTDVYEAQGGRFTRTVLLHYAEHGQIDPERLTPVVVDIGEALVSKYFVDMLTPPDDDYLAAIVDQAILPAVGHTPRPPEHGAASGAR